ncbi:bifunctional tetrahydrofolate synthase/dihydrofolate synthase [Shewanella violacea]|uniref:Dihydrofolate synthase/folylpolyglutamate synthase n=1 Tax=Shewanella violacea (strain JCM 10179 / CIP 106290 / LMG 19151 / DSS12) TaxID=637905 RepID=D4ZME8_SHEVD|nr:bifunctional tetrahydrofolate synthase/dihydrofolate synthase [Shewanella violacea]BAJ02847.1 FolC bifunctional protein [Shewanella violacea DSS12]
MPTVPTQDSSLDTWLDYLLAIHPTEIEMGLGRVAQVAERLGLKDLGTTKVITVAGTNGKGTTCAMVEQVLLLSGERVGVYSSPHMLKYNERVRIDGQDVDDRSFIQAFDAINLARGDISLSYFEFATLAGLYIFKAAKLDTVLLEVGLGGRLDAINIIDADIAVITSIDLDHQEYLGDTRESVGMEKAGILRANKPAIIGEPNLPTCVLEYANELGAVLHRVGKEFSYTCEAVFWQFTGLQTMNDIPMPSLPLPNAATALALLELGWPQLSGDIIRQGIQEARLTGRLEVVSEQPLVLLDVAHNPHAARYLAKQLEKHPAKRLFAICGMLKDKDCRQVIEVLAPLVDVWSFTSLQTDRSASGEGLKKIFVEQVQQISHPLAYAKHFDSVESAWRTISAEICQGDVVIVFGSFYTVAEFKNIELDGRD